MQNWEAEPIMPCPPTGEAPLIFLQPQIPRSKECTWKYSMTLLQLVFLLDHTLNTQDTRLPCPNGPKLSSGTWMGFFLGLAIKGKTVTGVCKPKTWGWPKPTVFVLFYVKKDRVNHKTPVVKDGTVGGNKRRAGHHDTKESNNSNLAFQGITKLYLSRKHQRIYYVTVC